MNDGFVDHFQGWRREHRVVMELEPPQARLSCVRQSLEAALHHRKVGIRLPLHLQRRSRQQRASDTREFVMVLRMQPGRHLASPLRPLGSCPRR